MCNITLFLNNNYNKITLKQRIWHLHNNNFNLQYCCICGELSPFERHIGYKLTCNKKCQNIYSKTEEFKEKRKLTNTERYGTENYTNKQKQKETCLERYGVEHYSKTSSFKESFKETCLERYGTENAMMSDIIKEKSKQTFIEKYGVEYYSQSKEFQNGLKSMMLKSHETKKKNNSYTKSKKEDEIYYFLIEQFGYSDIIRQYRDERYYNKITKNLFACDFYIKSLDLFLEYDGIWTHKPQYLPEIEKEKMLQIWKNKSKTSYYYECALVSYKYDCFKREISKENNLNIQFFRNKSEIIV